jgi:hypothetical protein
MDNVNIEPRETTYYERAVWGICPICNAPPGEWCYPEAGPVLGVRTDGKQMAQGDGAHLARLQRAPRTVRVVAC